MLDAWLMSPTILSHPLPPRSHASGASPAVSSCPLLLTWRWLGVSCVGQHTGDDDSGTLLGAAAFKGHLDIVRLLLDAQADVNGRNEAGNVRRSPTPLPARVALLASACADARESGGVG